MISGVLADVAVNGTISNDVKKVVEGIAQKNGVNSSDVQSIEKVGFDKLPGEVNLSNVDQTNLAVYKVNQQNNAKPFYVLTVSDEAVQNYQKQGAVYSRAIYDFGVSGTMSSSDFLDTSVGVKTSLDKGYVMVRGGSITGLSTNFDAVSGSGEVEVVIYKNGEPVGFRNSFVVDSNSLGIMKDYDTQSFGTVNFEAGDTISVYTKITGDVSVKDVITSLEVTSTV